MCKYNNYIEKLKKYKDRPNCVQYDGHNFVLRDNMIYLELEPSKFFGIESEYLVCEYCGATGLTENQAKKLRSRAEKVKVS